MERRIGRITRGAAITRAAEETFYGGYAGYFTAPDGRAGFTLR